MDNGILWWLEDIQGVVQIVIEFMQPVNCLVIRFEFCKLISSALTPHIRKDKEEERLLIPKHLELIVSPLISHTFKP